MLIKWKTRKWNEAQIERVECTRETEKAVWVLHYQWGDEKRAPTERRHMKVSEYEQYHDSWEVAHAYLMQQAEEALVRARLQLQAAQGTLGNVKGMRKPQDA